MEPPPPARTPLATALIFDLTIPPPLFLSYARLYAASWQHDYLHTDPLDFESQLVPLMGVRRSQARHHLRMLRFARLLDWTSDAHNHYVIRFMAQAESENADAVVGGGFNINTSKYIQQQQQQGPQAGKEPLAPFRGGPNPTSVERDDVFTRSQRYLLRAGVWEDVAVRLAAQISENQRSGRDNQPGLEDVLGWIAYCFADREKNKIGHSAAVLAANLNANRRCPEAYRPEPLCATCHSAGEYCQCEGEPDYYYPEEFLEAAFKRQQYSFSKDMWRVCSFCHALPCECGN